jgi:hypothetical protein
MAVIETAHHWFGHDLTLLGRLYHTGLGSIMAQPHVRTRRMIILQIRRQEPSQMLLVQHEDAIPQLAAERADQAFAVRILPGEPEAVTTSSTFRLARQRCTAAPKMLSRSWRR